MFNIQNFIQPQEIEDVPHKSIYEFKLPITFIDKKNLFSIDDCVSEDLELYNNDPSQVSMYNFLLNPDNKFSQDNVKHWNKYYTNDIEFLKDTQHIISNMSVFDSKKTTKCDIIHSIWEETKNNDSFYIKYNYFEWDILKKFNLSSFVLLILVIIHLSSPLIFFIMPLLIFIIPFFILKYQSIPITLSIYYSTLKVIITEHFLGKAFNRMDSKSIVTLGYVICCIFFYCFQIYQNINTCYSFYSNIKNVNQDINDLHDFINNSIEKIENFKLISSKCNSYESFTTCYLDVNHSNLISLKNELSSIDQFSFSFNKITQFGKILRCYYIIHSNQEYEKALQFAVGFDGYIDNMYNVHTLYKNGSLSFAKFSKGYKCSIKDQVYPSLINDENAVKNDFDISGNVIITGPNASGKTTAIKTTTINIIFTQQFGCGFYSSCKINPYTHIHSYINIPDTSNRDSLFQAESRRCKDIIDNILEKSSVDNYRHFCIFDELYSGTNPVEASKAGYAFLKYLNGFSNVDYILTTHYIYICKKFKKSNKIQNFKMKVDINNDGNYDFTYKMIPGISDLKGAIKVLKEMDYPREIIDTFEKI